MPLTSSNNNKTNEYSDKNMEVNNPVQSTKNTNEDVDVDKNLIASTTSSSWENNNSLYQLNNGSGNYLQGGTLLQHQAIYLPLQPQGYYAPLDSFGSLLNQYGGGYNPLANSTQRAPGLRPPPEGYTAPENSTQRYSVSSSAASSSSGKEPPTKKSKTTKTKITTERKNKRNAQSRKRAADLKEKIDSIKAKSDEDKTAEEKLLVKEVQLKREKKNKQTAKRAKEKKAEIDRINKNHQTKRTTDQANLLSTATSAKKRKNECASKIRREKNSGLKKKKTSNSDPGTIGKAKNKPKKDKEVAKTNSQSPGTFMQTMSAVAPRWHDLLKVCERSVTEEEEEQMEGV